MTLGLDIGTSFLISAVQTETGINFREMRDAFFKLKPPTALAAKMLEKGLANLSYFRDTDGTFIVVGQDAISKAIERNDSALRPMSKGILNPKEPAARRVLKFMLHELVGKPINVGDTLVYSVPAEPVDRGDEEFNTGYHEDVLKKDLGELGWNAVALNEAEAICYSELEEDEYTGICLSFGAGMVNACVMSSGDPVVRMSLTKSGDWIDRMVAQSTGLADSVVQYQKENGEYSLGEPTADPILTAVQSYYVRLIDYTIRHLSLALRGHKQLPNFTNSVPVVLAGGTSRINGFIQGFGERLSQEDFPLKVRGVRYAKDQLRSVARGCLLYSLLANG